MIEGFKPWGNKTSLAIRLSAYLLLTFATSCAGTSLLREPVPEALVTRADVQDYSKIRFYSDDQSAMEELVQVRITETRTLYTGIPLKNRKVDIRFLSISGGGSDGAFGAGFLNGWTATGQRPRFDVVTGVSTGAMIAPMAYLGTDYDTKLKEAYTTISTEDVAKVQLLPALLGQANSLSSNGPLQAMVAKYMTQSMLNEIADEYRKGRMLLIGTTNLDAQRPVIWDIGAIAVSGRPDALALTRQIILASAAIPGAFPPVQIKVQVDGKVYDELHVDGGVTRQVFMYPPGYNPRVVDKALGWKAKRYAYIIRNAKIDPQFKITKAKLLPISARSIDTLIKSQGIGDLYRIYATASRDGVDYNVAYIPSNFSVPSKSTFDRAYMNALYELGYSSASSGYKWHKSPPQLDVSEKR
jgi:hypothetical protein